MTLSERRSLLEGRWWIALWFIAAGVRIAVAVPLSHDWDSFVFTESSRSVLDGTSPYATVEEDPPYIYPRSNRPMLQQWYAYPALPLVAFTSTFALARATGLHAFPLMEQFSVKIPAIAGDLVCAALILRFLRSRGTRMARQAALLVLFNPLLIWVSSAWGMFDIWIVNFVLLFLIAIRDKRPVHAGVFLGLAPQVKLFPLFFLPTLLAHAFHHVRERGDRMRLLAAFGAVGAVLVLPFLATSPRGFLTQNLVMHLRRPPQGIGLAGLLDFLRIVQDRTFGSFVPVLGVFVVVVLVLVNVWGVVLSEGKERRVVAVMLLAYAVVMLGNKVVNEQYFSVMVVLIVVASRLAPDRRSVLGAADLRRLEGVMTTCVFGASILLGFHFLTFLPPELARRMGGTTDTLVFHLRGRLPRIPAHSFPATFADYYNLPNTLAYVLMVPVLVLLASLVIRGAVGAAIDLKRPLFSVRALSTRRGRTVAAATSVALVAVLLSIVSLGSPEGTRRDASSGRREPKVGAFYYAWWGNPTHQAHQVTDVWNKTTQTPTAGYYDSKTPYFVHHIEQMQNAGIDFAVVSYHLYDRGRFLTFAKHADDAGFAYAPMIEPEEVLVEPELRPVQPTGEPGAGFRVSPETATLLADFSSSVFPRSGPGERWLRIDGKPVVFVYNAHQFLPSWDGASRRDLSERIVERYKREGTDDVADRIADAWGERAGRAPEYRYPTDVPSFNNANPETASKANEDFRRAFLDAYADLWRTVRRAVEKRTGPIYLVGTAPSPIPTEEDAIVKADDLARLRLFDNTFAYSPASTWSAWRLLAKTDEVFDIWNRHAASLAGAARAAHQPLFQTVMPAYDDRTLRGGLGYRIPSRIAGSSTYDRTWRIALSNHPDYVLVTTWNEFFEGTAIEPTREYGDVYLDATRRWSDRLRSATRADATGNADR